MRELTNQLYQFDAFQLDPDERRLTRDGKPVSLTPKAFDTLVLLVERAGHLIEKEELMKALWPDSFVEEANLAQYVWTLRKVLGEARDGGQFIETVARKGFRFVTPVTRRDKAPVIISIPRRSEPARRKTLALFLISLIILATVIGFLGYRFLNRRAPSQVANQNPVSETHLQTIAVLPFMPLSDDSRNESLELGMTETIITHLSNIRQLAVRPIGAVRKYTDPHQDPLEIGRQLQVAAVLDGSIQKVGDRVRVTVRLTNVATGANVWTQQFDERFTDIFAVQDSISERVASTLPQRLDGREQGRLMRRYTQSPEAYQLYLQAQYLWDNRNKLNREKMAQYYQEAIEKDPTFALAYVGMADLQITMVGDNILAYDEIKSQIANNLAKALELDPELAQARNLRAEVKYQFDFDWIEAEKEFKKAIELNPNVASIRLAYGWFLMSAGRFEEATKEMAKAQELDPHSAVINRARGKLLYFSHRFDEAIEHLKRIVEAEPRNPINHRVLAEAYEENGMYAEAIGEIGQAGRANGADEGKITADLELFKNSGWQAYLEKRLERDLDDLKHEYVSPMIIAGEFLKVGKKDEALTWLDKAVETRASGIPNLKVDPIFVSLHSDPRFVKLLARMNLTP